MYGKYGFVDPGEVAGVDDIYPAEAMKIDGIMIEDKIDCYQTLQVSGRELLAQEITPITIGKSDGEQIQYTRRPARVITVKYMINARSPDEFRQAFYVLNGILDGQDRKLVFNDDHDKYYIGTLQDVDSVPAGDNSVTSTFTFLIPDGTAHSLVPNTVTPDTNNQLLVNNQGTATAYPVITATMKSENGLVAFVNDKGGVLQFGSPDEVDTVTKVKSDKVIDDGMRPGQTGYTFNVGPINYAKSVGSGVANTFDGSIKFVGETAEPQFIDDGIKHWHGPSMHRTVPTNSLGDNTGSFIWRTRFNYNTDAKGLGYLEINLTSGNKVIASFAMYDGNSSIVEQKTQYFVNGKQLKAVAMNPRLFGNGFYELTVTRNQGKGNFKLSKVAKLNGESVVSGSTYQVPFVDPTFDTAVIDGVTIWFMKFADSKATSMNISDMNFNWINVPYIEDIPNRFTTGDVVTVDVANRKVYLNGVIDNTLQTVGNQWDTFKLDPGINTIQPVGSSWATQFDTQLTYREAWL